MPQRHDDDEQHVIVDRVDDPVIADPYAETRSPLEGFRAWRPWVLPQQRDGTADPVAIVTINSLQCANCGRSQFDSIRHTQPRSTLT